MCGRFTLALSAEVLAEYFALLDELDLYSLLGRPHPRWNIAPTDPVLTLANPTLTATAAAPALATAAGHRMMAMQWGMPQPFSRGRPLFNARDDKLNERFWKRSFVERRCVVPVSSFYEWQDVGARRRVPYEIRMAAPPVAAFAGVWDETLNRESGELVRWCSIITTAACPLLQEIHNAGANRFRQPAFVDRSDVAAWLAPGELSRGVVERILRVRDSEEFEAWPLERIGDDEERRAPVARIESTANSEEKRPPAKGKKTAAPADQPGLPFG